MGFNSVVEGAHHSGKENEEYQWHQIKLNKLPIGLVVKHLRFIKISKILISRKISEIKNCDVVPLFYIKTIDRKTL